MTGSYSSDTPFRAFIAIELTPETSTEIDAITDALSKKITGQPIHWIDFNKLHITLNFFEKISEPQAQALIHQIRERLQSTSSFQLSFDKLIALPSPDRPRVIALYAPESAPLAAIADMIIEQAIPLGIVMEKRSYKAHLTIARIKKPFSLKKVLKQITFASVMIDVKTITLFKSELTPQGSIYTVLERMKLT